MQRIKYTTKFDVKTITTPIVYTKSCGDVKEDITSKFDFIVIEIFCPECICSKYRKFTEKSCQKSKLSPVNKFIDRT